MMSTPSNTFHGCFGHNRFSVGRFTGDTSELFDDSELTTVRSKKGVQHFTKDKISKFSTGWKTASNRHSLINLAVAPKANDQFVHVYRAPQRSTRAREERV